MTMAALAMVELIDGASMEYISRGRSLKENP